MIGYMLLLIGIIALFFPFDPDMIEPADSRQEKTSLLANLGGEGVVAVIKIGGLIFIFFGITVIFT